MNLAKIMVFVPDIAEAKRFYSEVLGFELRTENDKRLVFAHESCDFIAHKCDKPTSSGDYAREARAVFVFCVPDIEKAIEALRSRGVRVLHSTPGQSEDGRYAAFVDPFGIVHEIFERHAT
ncbi:MAG: VOC family protein [Limisphaerales bacterium]